MQINRRDYIEFQLEESNGGGGAGGIVVDAKLDYSVTMAIEKNTKLLAQYTLQQRRDPQSSSINNNLPLGLEHLTKSTNLPQYKSHTLGRPKKQQLNGLGGGALPVTNLGDNLDLPNSHHLPPLLETETRYTTTTTFSDKRLQLAHDLRQYHNNNNHHNTTHYKDTDRGGGRFEEFIGSNTNLVASCYKENKTRSLFSPPSPAKEIPKASDCYWEQEDSNTQFHLDVDHYRRRLLRLTGNSVNRREEFNFYGTFNDRHHHENHRKRASLPPLAPPIMAMMDTDYYRLANRSCVEDQQLQEEEQEQEEHAKLLHRMLMMTTQRPPQLEANEKELLSNYQQRNGSTTAPPFYLVHEQQQHQQIGFDAEKLTTNGFIRPLAPLAAIDQEQEFEPRYYQQPLVEPQQQQRESEWRKSAEVGAPQLMFGATNTENHQYGCGQLNSTGTAGGAGTGGETTATGRGLGKLFNRSAHYTQIVAALAISLGPIAAGLAKGYASPAIDSLQEYSPRKNGTNGSFYVSDQSASWLASLSLLGALFGGMFGGLAMQFGRKRVLAVMSLPFSMFWVMTVFAQSVETMFLTAFFAGFCVSIISMVTQVYVSEIASPDIRGFLSAIQKVAGHVGFLLSFSLGAYLDWRQLAMLVAIAPIMLFLTVIYIPETPSYLLLKGRDEEAYTALQFLRGPNSCVDLELETIRSNIRIARGNAQEDVNASPLSTRKNRFKLHGFTVTSGRDCLIVLGNSIKSLGDKIKAGLRNARLIKPILITCGLMVFQRFTGPNSFNFYAVKIFRQTFAGMNPHGGAVAVGFVQLLASMLSGLLIDTVGRIPLLIISTVFMSLAFACLGSYIYYEQGAKLAATNAMDFEALSEASYNDWIPLLCVLIFMVAFSLGISPISSLLVGELFPLEYRAMGSSIATSFSFFCSFLSVKTFVDFQEKLGLHGVFWLYSGISCIGLIFVVTCVPETKGKDLDEMHPKFVQTLTINNR